METKFHGGIRKTLAMIPLVWMVLFFFFGVFGSSAIYAQGKEILPESILSPKIQISQGPLQQINKYFSTRNLIYSDGTSLIKYTINGPPTPPPGYELELAAVALPEPDPEMGINILTVPAFNWVFGCSSVSGAMIAGYYDRNGFPNMYTGPTNGGVMPLDNSSWPNWSDGHTTYPNLPLAASHQGVDGRATLGSIDDYWIQYGSSSSDPYIGHWTQHTWGEAIGDYMKTSQSAYSNTDGSTSFYGWNSSQILTCSAMVGYNIHNYDGTYGRKLFYEARGYTVTDCYSQATDNKYAGGFSFAQYKAEIDAGRPVMLNLQGHTIVGVGYDDSANTVYIHDTWDYSNHTMTWGGSYSGMQLLSVSIVNLHTVAQPPAAFNKSTPTNGATGQLTSLTLSWGSSAGATSYDYCYDTNNNGSCDGSWVSTGTNTSVILSVLSTGTVYSWQVRANNTSGTTYANSNEWWSFTTTGPPAAATLISPSGTLALTSPTYYWNAVSNAAQYNLLVNDSTGNKVNQWYTAAQAGCASGTGVCSVTPSAVLALGSGNWQIQTQNSYGLGPWSSTLNFNVVMSAPKVDFNSDGMTDIFWRHKVRGDIAVWYMDGITLSGSTVFYQGIPLDWEIVGTGDFNNDGRTDILWRNVSTGQLYIWLMNGTTIISMGSPATISDPNWQIKGVGDFNGDGKADILWRHALTGQVYVWQMNGTAIASQGSSGTVSDPNWQIKGVGDFNGDGKTDILWRHAISGQVFIWQMNGTAIASQGSPGTVSDLNWEIKGVSDFNGDGKIDILWRHAISGQVFIWQMNGTAIGSQSSPGTVSDLNWEIKGVSDFNGDGKADILWRHNLSGMLYIWIMNGTFISSMGSPGTVGDSSWTIVAP